MITEMSEGRLEAPKGWILFDGECALCRRSVERWRATLEQRGFAFVALQTQWVRERLGVSGDELLREMRVLRADGRVYGGADAVIEMARQVWWMWPLVALAWAPGMKRPLRAAYRAVASRRNCANGSCGVSAERTRQMT